jgi:hypothetical protein
MSEASHDQSGGPAHRTVEMGVAVACMIFGDITIIGSMQVGVGWDATGPRSGFFPFYLGIIIVLSSVMNMNSARAIDGEREFATWHQLKQVLAVIIPTTVYVFVLPYTGIYFASMVLFGGFMLWLGKYPLYKSIIYGVVVPVGIYFMFEKWFLVPLPKGPIEYWLGL